jgi:hypothetical protein
MYFDSGMPEWMDDNNDDDNHLSNATFEQDGTFTRLSSVPQNDSNEQQKPESVSDESLSQKNPVSIDFDYIFHFSLSFYIKVQSRQEEEIKSEKSIPQTDTATINVPAASKPVGKLFFPKKCCYSNLYLHSLVSQPTPPVQQSIPSWDDDFDQSDVATTVVESTLAEVRKSFMKNFFY